MGVEKERRSTFLTALEQREKEARSLFAAQSDRCVTGESWRYTVFILSDETYQEK